MPEAPAANLDEQARRRFRRGLLRWYRQNHRTLPWRAAPGELANPYHVLVSEAMLQQTQVSTVIPYFRRFIEALPTVEALAGAEEQAVLRLWQGLGYYRRARHLHAAARCIVHDHAGEMPTSAEALRRLPGVGPYTAGAIASIAFGRQAPILDGNVARVLARWAGLTEPIDTTRARKRLWALAGELVRGRSPGELNQGLMELGATVCTKGAPHCLLCPVARDCAANRDGLTETLPVVSPRRKPREVTHHVVAVRKGGRYLFERRGSDGLWAGMWQLPTVEGEPGEADDEPGEVVERLRERLGVRVALADGPAGEFTHQTTHRTIRVRVIPATVAGGRLRPRAGVWRRLDELDDLPLAKPQQRAIALLSSDRSESRT